MPQAFCWETEGKELCDNVVVHGEVLRVGHIPCCEFDFLQGLVVSAVSERVACRRVDAFAVVPVGFRLVTEFGNAMQG